MNESKLIVEVTRQDLRRYRATLRINGEPSQEQESRPSLRLRISVGASAMNRAFSSPRTRARPALGARQIAIERRRSCTDVSVSILSLGGA